MGRMRMLRERGNHIRLSLLLIMSLLSLTACQSEYGQKIEELRNTGVVAVLSEEEKAAAEEEWMASQETVILPEEKRTVPYTAEDGTCFYFKANEQYLSVYEENDFEEIYIKGVNIGLGKPGYFPGETAISKEEYSRWFQQIGEMNANCIRVYTVQPPFFYEALYEYNQKAKQPLYLFHGTWYDETRMLETADAFDEELTKYLYQDMRNLVDLIHGDCVIEEERGKASGAYQCDVSPWVIGWILGIESDANLVSVTNELHPELTTYRGEYLYTDEKVEPFEVFWAQTGDYIISYEMEKYRMQRPVSYSNWPTADLMEHPSETMDEEYRIDLNMNHLHATEAFPCGLFAAYHVYPYYPNFMYTQKEYIAYRDEDNEKNTYRAYLEELITQHEMPIVIAEFGVPASRGITHANPFTGLDQGNHTEQEQGEMLVSMMQDIYDTGFAGGLVFTWQDEWFKRTWNTEARSNAERRAYWYDVMTCEQHFGILDFVPGEEKATVILDGDASEWSSEEVLLQTDDMELSVKHDCAYLYLMINKENAKYHSEEFVIPIDVTPNSGSMNYGNNYFERAADFVLRVNGKNDTKLLTQSYYDMYLYENDKFDDSVRATAKLKSPNSDVFEPIYFLLERELILPDRNEVFPLARFEVGQLVYGTNNYDSLQYNSLADYYYKDDIMEIRIPWLMLNFRDPSRKEIEGDFWKNDGHVSMNVEGIWLGLSDLEKADENTANKTLSEGKHITAMKEYRWENWDIYPYFERLRKSYYILQEQYKNLER